MNPDWVWLVWLSVTLGSFGVLEAWALTHRRSMPAGTLSEWLRRWLGIEPHRPWRSLGVAVFGGFLGWLCLHITAGLWP